jgi:hypothetical protein
MDGRDRLERRSEKACAHRLRAAGFVIAMLGVCLALPPAVAQDTGPQPPKPHELSLTYDAIQQSVIRPSTRAFDVSLLVRKLGGSRREAENVDERDQVRLPSTWWTPRVGFQPVSVEQMLAGPGSGEGPAPGPWTVVRAKTEGVSKGFQIKDAKGVRFAIKFDPVGLNEIATGPDVICSRLYWAAGYNVPDNSITFFAREDLVVAEGATYEVGGKRHAITPASIDDLLEDIPPGPDDRYRVVASRYLTGKPLGEWRYDGRTKDDPEDAIPHQHRREIRGLWALHAWLNNTDGSARNTIDMWVTEGGRSFVRHHLIDFSGCLGSASIAAQSASGGHEYLLDYGAATRGLATVGLARAPWERAVDPEIPSVGFVESEVFDPGGWKPFLPNPAFDVRTDRDARWGAMIVAGFSDEHIRAAVAMGRYSDPRASEYLTRILIERRDRIAARWLTPEESLAAREATVGGDGAR